MANSDKPSHKRGSTMTDKPRDIVQALAQQIDKKEKDIELAESLGKGNTSEVRAWKNQAQQWQTVLDKATTREQRRKK